MSSFIPFVVVALALIAALSIIYIAWQLSSREIQDSLEKSLGRPATADEEAESAAVDPKDSER